MFVANICVLKLLCQCAFVFESLNEGFFFHSCLCVSVCVFSPYLTRPQAYCSSPAPVPVLTRDAVNKMSKINTVNKQASL